MTPFKLMATGAGFVLIFLSGYWLKRTGQPFNAAALTIHKLIAVATVAYLVVTVLGISKIAPLGRAEWIAAIAVIVLFAAAIASGGWLAAVANTPAAARALHLILPILTALSSAVFLYLLFHRE